MRDKQVLRSYFLLLLAVGILLLVQWAYPHVPFLRDNFKNSNFLTYYLQQEEIPDSLLAPPIDSSVFDQLDTLVADSSRDSTATDSLPPIQKIDEAWFKNDSAIVPDTANLAYLSAFFEGLKKKKTRVLYWGDSMIEGDLITQTLRRKLQQQYGGTGVGFVPMVSITAGFRRTVIHKYGGPWNYYSIVKNAKLKQAPFGLNAEYMTVGKDSTGKKAWAQYTVPKGKKDWNKVQFFYGKGNGKAKVTVRINKKPDQHLVLSDTNTVNRLVFSDSSIHRFYIQIDSGYQTVFFGVSLENEEGVQVDNLSLRGNSGMAQTRISSPILRGFREYLEPDLIVLHFGINVINASTMDYSWYEKAMTRVVRHYQSCYPHASILIIGVADKGFKKGDEMVSDPSVRRVLKTQYKVALKTGVAFWNLYAAMGGQGSMVEWADAEKPLANKDYTHLNFRGAEKVGLMLYDFLMEERKKHD